jgi:hypothetical protein
MRSPFRPDALSDSAVLHDHKPLIRSLERRGLIRGGLSFGALVMLTGCDVKRPEAVESALLAISRLNDGVQAFLFDPNKLAPTYPASMILRPPKFNAYYDVMDVKPVNGETWRLDVSGLVTDKRPWTLQDLRALPQASMGHQAYLRRGLELYRRLERPDAAQLPGARRGGCARQIRRLQDG